MVVGVRVWELEIVGSRSLKDKRRILKSLKDRIRNRHNVSVAETAHQDLWQRAEIAVAVVSGDRAHAESLLDRLEPLVAGAHGARISDSHRVFY